MRIGNQPVDTCILVPGVGIAGWSFEDLAALLRGRVRVVVHERATGQPFEEQVDALEEVVQAQQGAAVVGVSGGATLGLALAIRRPAALLGSVLHEPLVGPLQPGLDARVRELSGQLSRDPAYGAMAFVAELVGVRTWNQLPEERRRGIGDLDESVAADVNSFCSFAPTIEQLHHVRGLPLVASHGHRSSPEREAVTALLEEHCGATGLRIEDCGHAAQLDNPSGLMAAIDRLALGEVA